MEFHPTKVGYAKNTTLVGFIFLRKSFIFLEKNPFFVYLYFKMGDVNQGHE